MSATWTTLVGKYDWDASRDAVASCRSPDGQEIGNKPDKNSKSKPKGNPPRSSSSSSSVYRFPTSLSSSTQ